MFSSFPFSISREKNAPKSGKVQWQHWYVFRRACGQLVVLRIAAKGRSCSRLLNSILRRLNAHVLVRLWFLHLLWLCGAMPPSKVKKRTEARRTERQRRGSLADLAVEAVTLGRYQQTLWNFFRYQDDFRIPMPCTVWHLDDELSQYVEELWAVRDGFYSS